MKKIYLILFLVILIIVTGFLFLHEPKIQADSGDNIYGYAWSDNIGWISFNNCKKDGSCTGPEYGVKYNLVNGEVNGNAWSSSIGWVRFGGLSSIPNGGSNARLDLENGELKGWARACAGMLGSNYFNFNNTCSGDSRADGWDGWISLDGTTYGVAFDPTTGLIKDLNSGLANKYRWAWGGNVVGWLDFSKVTIDSLIPSPILELYATPTIIDPQHKYSIISWYANSQIDNTQDCDASGGWGGKKKIPFQAEYGFNTGELQVSTTYTLTCFVKDSPTNETKSASVTVGVDFSGCNFNNTQDDEETGKDCGNSKCPSCGGGGKVKPKVIIED